MGLYNNQKFHMEDKASLKPILITGAHRSGTTWVGKVVASVDSIDYIHEPFNIDYSPLEVKPQYWFQYINRENEALLYKPIKQLISEKIPYPDKSKKRPWINNSNVSIPTQRKLIKDPIAIFSVEWLASRFNMDVVILIRHPAAFADSLRERNWTHDFSHFLNQELLMKQHLYPFEDEIIKFTKTKYDIIDQAILLWKLIYHMVDKYQGKHKDWLFIKHEELSFFPLKGFKRIFNHLNIPFSRELKSTVKQYSSHSNPIEGDVHSIKRNSKAIIKRWKKKLSHTEIRKIREEVETISEKFYTSDEW